jgi:DNA recombination protein RmuC
MDPMYAIPAAIVVAAILVFAIAFSIWRMIAAMSALRAAKADTARRLAVEEEKASRIPGLEGSLTEKTKEADALRDSKASIEKEFATLTEALSQTRHRLEIIEKTRDELIAKLETASTEKSDLESKLAYKTAQLEETSAVAKGLRDELALTATTLGNSRSDLVDLRTEHATLQETLEQVRRQAEEKLALLREAKDQMTNEFKLLAQEIMMQHGESFKRQNMEQLAGVLVPLREKLVEFQQGLLAPIPKAPGKEQRWPNRSVRLRTRAQR